MSSPTITPEAVDEILAKLAKDVEKAVHSMYRSEVGVNTTQIRTEHFVTDARDRIGAFLKSSPAAAAGAAPPRFTAAVAASSISGDGADGGWSADEAAAVTKCIMAWLPIGSPSSAKPESKCMAPGKELLPSWGEREVARNAVRKVPVRQ
jgi:hypothetical protein